MLSIASTINGVLEIDSCADAVEFENRWWTWGNVATAKEAIEKAWLKNSLSPGARIAILLRSRAELISAVLATVAQRHCLVTLNAVYPDSSLAADISKEKAPVLIANSSDWSRREIRDAAFASGALCVEMPTQPGKSITILKQLDDRAIPDMRMYNEGTAVEMLTSGTTGPPKRIPTPAEHFERAIGDYAIFEKGRNKDDLPQLRSGVQVLTQPFAHIGGLMALINAIVSGRKTCLIEKFTVEAIHDAVRRHRPKVISMPPSGLKMLFDARPPREDLASLRAIRTGTAPLNPDLADAVTEYYAIPVLQNYGATEFGGVGGWNLSDYHTFYKAKRGSVGRINPGIKGQIVDPDTGKVLPPGEQGVLELGGARIGDGKNWVRTTDLASIDTDGFLFIKGRADGAIIRGGFKIQPQDIATAIEEHESVLEAAVTSLPDERLGQVPVAAYVLKSGAQAPSENELKSFLRQRLAPYQVPTKLLCVEELPRTVSMKVGTVELRKLFQ